MWQRLIGTDREKSDERLEDGGSGEDDARREEPRSQPSASHSTLHRGGRGRARTTPTLEGRHYRHPDPTASGRPCSPSPTHKPRSPPGAAAAPAPQVRACATRHFRLQVSPPEDSRPGGCRTHQWLRWAPRRKARRPRRGASAAQGARGAGTPPCPPARLPNTHPGPRGCPDESRVASAAAERQSRLRRTRPRPVSSSAPLPRQGQWRMRRDLPFVCKQGRATCIDPRERATLGLCPPG